MRRSLILVLALAFVAVRQGTGQLVAAPARFPQFPHASLSEPLPEGRYLAEVRGDDAIRVDAQVLAWRADGNAFAAWLASDGRYRLSFEFADGRHARPAGFSTAYPYGARVAWSPDGRRVAIARQRVAILGPDFRRQVLLEGRWRAGLLWSPDGGLLLAGRRLYRTDTWELVGTIPDLHLPSWSPDGSRLAYLDGEAAIRLWDRATGRSVTIDDHTWPGEYSIWSRPPQWSPGGHGLAVSTGINSCCIQPNVLVISRTRLVYFDPTPDTVRYISSDLRTDWMSFSEAGWITARGGSCESYNLLAIPLENFIPNDDPSAGGLFGYEIVYRDHDHPATHPLFVNRGRWIAYAFEHEGEVAFFDPARHGARARHSVHAVDGLWMVGEATSPHGRYLELAVGNLPYSACIGSALL